MNALLKSSLFLFSVPYAILIAAEPKSQVGAQIAPPIANTDEIRIVPVERTPEPEEIQLTIVFPEENAMKSSTPIKVQIKDEGFPLGVNSDFQREKEIANDPGGQSVHVWIDNKRYIPVYDDWVDALENDVVYFESTIEFDIPFKLEPGMHVIRAFPIRTFYESLKGDGCFTSSVFYYKTKDNPKGYNINGPYLTYNQPAGELKWRQNKPILLDFYVTNAELSVDGYKVKVLIDGKAQRVIHQWTPFYIYGLAKGTHKLRLQLLDEQNNIVPGPFNDVEETFVLN